MRHLTISKIWLVIALTGMFLTSGVGALPPDLMKRLNAFQAAIEKEAKRKVPEQPGLSHPERDDSSEFLATQFRMVIARVDLNEIDRLVGEIASVYQSDSIRQMAGNLQMELHVEIEKKEAAAVAHFRALIDNASRAVGSATKAADLDATLRSLSLGDSADRSSLGLKIGAERSRADTARQFVIYWQDYLASLEWDDTRTAIQKLESASNLKIELLPRSEILTRVGRLKKTKGLTPGQRITEIMGKTKSLEAIPAAIDALLALEQEEGGLAGPKGATIVFLRGELATISAAYQEHRSGFPTTFSIKRFNNQLNDDDPVRLTQSLRLELLRFVLPRVLGVGENLQPKRDETMQSYLDRIVAQAAEKLDARLLVRAREFQNALSGERQMDLTALQPLLAAQNQDTAEQFAPAVASYQMALKIGGDLVPARAIGARLEAIKASHPAEYSQGMEQFLKNPPSFPYRGGSSSSAIAIPGAATQPTAPPGNG